MKSYRRVIEHPPPLAAAVVHHTEWHSEHLPMRQPRECSWSGGRWLTPANLASAQLVRVVAQQSSRRTSPSTFSSQRFCRQMAVRWPSAGRAPHTVSCSPDADTDGSSCSRRSPWRTARHWGPRRAPASDPQRRLSITSPHAPPPSILIDERTRVEAVKRHGDFAVLSSTAGCSSFSVWNSGWNSETALVRGDGERRHAQAVGTRRSPAGRRDWIGFSYTFSSDHCGRNRAHNTSSADPPMTLNATDGIMLF